MTTKEIILSILFNNGEQSLVKMDGKHYEKFLVGAYSEPVQQKAIVKGNQKQGNNKFLIGLGWFVVPYIMLLANWKKLKNPYRIAGIVWTIILLIGAFTTK
jgi:hypothetical protein